MSKLSSSYDVIVAGAGPAGSVAALQAARAGAKTLLIEHSSLPGGTTTLCGVDFPGLFHAWGTQVIAGIGWELVTSAVKEVNGTLPDFSRYDLPHPLLQVRISAPVYACLLDEAFIASGVDVLYHAMPLTVEEQPDRVCLTVATKDRAINLNCLVAIDATGDANLVTKAGYKLKPSDEKQPGSPILRLGGYDLDKVDLPEIESAYRAAVAAGEMEWLDTGMARSMAHLLQCHGENCIHVAVDDGCSSEGKSEVEQRARATVLRIYRFLQRFPGLEHLEISTMAPQCGVRESAIIDGEATITVDDYVSGRYWSDSLCHAFYQLDLHQRDEASGLMARPLDFGVVPTVPRRALIPRGSQRILAAGRCVSSDRLANSALRVQASCMAMGQSAGALAAVSVDQQRIPADLDITDVRKLLLAHGAIVPSPRTGM